MCVCIWLTAFTYGIIKQISTKLGIEACLYKLWGKFNFDSCQFRVGSILHMYEASGFDSNNTCPAAICSPH